MWDAWAKGPQLLGGFWGVLASSLHLLEEGRGGAEMRREVTHERPRSPASRPTPAEAQTAAGSTVCSSVSPWLMSAQTSA